MLGQRALLPTIVVVVAAAALGGDSGVQGRFCCGTCDCVWSMQLDNYAAAVHWRCRCCRRCHRLCRQNASWDTCMSEQLSSCNANAAIHPRHAMPPNPLRSTAHPTQPTSPPSSTLTPPSTPHQIRIESSPSVRDAFSSELFRLSAPQLKRLSFQGSSNLRRLVLSPLGSCPQLESLEAGECPSLDYVLVQSNTLKTLDLGACGALSKVGQAVLKSDSCWQVVSSCMMGCSTAQLDVCTTFVAVAFGMQQRKAAPGTGLLLLPFAGSVWAAYAHDLAPGLKPGTLNNNRHLQSC